MQRPVLAHDQSQRGLVIHCHSDAVRARISGEALKEILVIAVHASELIYMHQNSVTKFLKRALRDSPPQPKSCPQESDARTTGQQPRAAGWFRRKISKMQRVTEELVVAGTAKETVLQQQHGGARETGDAATESSEPADSAEPDSEANEAQTTPWLLSATAAVDSFELVVTGEPRGGSVDALTLGVRSHGTAHKVLIGRDEYRSQWSLEGIEILSFDKGQNGLQSPRDAEAADVSYSTWPRTTMSIVHKTSDTLSYEAYSTASPEKVVKLSEPGDLLKVLDRSELAKLLQLARTVVDESDRLRGMVAPLAAKVGLGDKIPRFPASYGAAIEELTTLTGVTTAGSDSEGHAVENVRAELRTLVDQQVAKYSPVVEQLLHRAGGGNAAITSLAHVLKGDMDIETAKNELQVKLMQTAQDRLALLETELSSQLADSAEQLNARAMAAAVGAETDSAIAQTLSGPAWSGLVNSVIGGVRDITAMVATDPTALNATKMKEALADRSSQLEAVVRDEVERRVDQRVASLPLEKLESQAVEALQRENARLAAEIAKLQTENARLHDESSVAQ